MVPRICIISRPDLQPTVHGAAVRIMRSAEALSRLGATVYIVTNDRLWFYEAVGGFINRRRYPQAMLSLTNLPPVLKNALNAHGVPSYWKALTLVLERLGYPRDEHFLYQPLIDGDFWLRVLYVGWAHRVQVFQAEFPGYAVPAMLAAQLLDARSALVEHNVEYKRLADTTQLPAGTLERIRRIEAFCARNVDHLIVLSEVDRQLLLEDGVEDARLEVIPHGVDLERYSGLKTAGIRARYRIPEAIPLLVFHGTLHYWPNTVAVRRIAEVLLPGLEAAGVEVRVMICGMNPPRYYSHPHIIFTDVVQDLPEHLASAELAIVPLEDGGGTRLKILEYFAAGLPVVSTEKGAEGIPARGGVELLLAPDVASMVPQVLELLNNPARARAVGEAGRAYVQAYSWDAVCGRLLDVYQRPVPGRRASATDDAATRSTSALAGRLASSLWSWLQTRFPDAPHRERAPHPEAAGQAAPEQAASTGASPAAEPSERAALLAISSHLPQTPVLTKPLTMIMMINRGCNLRCSFCDLYEHPQRFPRESAEKVLREAAELGVKTVVFTGGEPLMHPDLWALIRFARALGMGTNVTSNGTLVARHLEALLDSGLDSISISLDGLQETHEALRKIKGCHEQTLTGLRLLREHGVHTNIYFVITGQNVHELVPVYRLAQSMGCGFDFWPVNDAHELYVVTPEHREAYRAALLELSAQDPAVAARQDYYLAGLDYHAGWDRRVRCLGLIEQFGINLEGELVPCCVWDNKDLRVGSAIQEPLHALWTGEQARARREQIFHEGCHNRCFNHSLYEFQLATGMSFVVGEGGAP